MEVRCRIISVKLSSYLHIIDGGKVCYASAYKGKVVYHNLFTVSLIELSSWFMLHVVGFLIVPQKDNH